MTSKLPPRTKGRAVLPDDEDVRPIPGVLGYIISRAGSVYSDTDPPLTMGNRNHFGRKSKRRRVRLSANGRVRDYYVGALVLEAWVGMRPEGAVAQHYDGDTLNCHADNLFWGYPQTRIDPREFVSVWQSAQSVREVAERLGKEYATVVATARRLREHGVNLRTIEQRNQSDKDYKSLAQLADELEGGEQ